LEKNRRRPLIYALTADEDESTKDLILKHPFLRRFCSLAVDIELPLIKNDILENLKPIENAVFKQERSLLSISEISDSQQSVSEDESINVFSEPLSPLL